MDTTRAFGQWLKQRRKTLGLTQKDLAAQAGCAEVTLRKVESGDLVPSAELAAALAKAAGCADADLPGIVALARGLDNALASAARRTLPRHPNNLAAQLTPLFGREHDTAAVRKRLLADGTRLVTLLELRRQQDRSALPDYPCRLRPGFYGNEGRSGYRCLQTRLVGWTRTNPPCGGGLWIAGHQIDAGKHRLSQLKAYARMNWLDDKIGA